MTVCCVIVTYGDRFDLFSQVIEAVWKEDIDKIVLVSNGSFDRSHKRALELEKRYHPVLMVHHLPDNCGSAGGFKKGLEIALQTACDYIWILDDDNKPAPGALGILKRFWVLETNEQDKQDTALSSLRKDRENYLQALLRNDPDLILQPVNNYAGFHIKTISHKIKERICPAEATPELIHLPALKLKAAAYGGLFFHKELLKKIGLPNESFVLYSDDFDFTYRIALKGGGIWLLPSSILHDVETSYYLPKQKKFLYHSVFDAPGDSFVYYSFRNAIYFSNKYRMDNPLARWMNKILFWLFISVIGILRGNLHRLRVLKHAIQDGESGRLGNNPKYTLE